MTEHWRIPADRARDKIVQAIMSDPGPDGFPKWDEIFSLLRAAGADLAQTMTDAMCEQANIKTEDPKPGDVMFVFPEGAVKWK